MFKINAIVTVSNNPYKCDLTATIAQVMSHSISTINAIRLLFPTSHDPDNSSIAANQSILSTSLLSHTKHYHQVLKVGCCNRNRGVLVLCRFCDRGQQKDQN